MKFPCCKCGHVNDVNIGAILGSRKSEAKRQAARLNAMKPAKPGSKPRGWPKGKPRKVVELPPQEKPAEMITPPLPPTPAERRRGDRRAGGVEVSPKPTSQKQR